MLGPPKLSLKIPFWIQSHLHPNHTNRKIPFTTPVPLFSSTSLIHMAIQYKHFITTLQRFKKHLLLVLLALYAGTSTLSLKIPFWIQSHLHPNHTNRKIPFTTPWPLFSSTSLIHMAIQYKHFITTLPRFKKNLLLVLLALYAGTSKLSLKIPFWIQSHLHPNHTNRKIPFTTPVPLFSSTSLIHMAIQYKHFITTLQRFKKNLLLVLLALYAGTSKLSLKIPFWIQSHLHPNHTNRKILFTTPWPLFSSTSLFHMAIQYKHFITTI